MDFLSLQGLLYSVPLVLPLFYLFFCHHPSKRNADLTTSTTYSPLGILPQYLKNRHRFLEWITEVFASGPTLSMIFQSPGQDSGVITADPLNVEHILKTNFNNYPKGERTQLMAQDFLGHGIFNSDGELWRLQRKTTSYEFNQRSLRNFVKDTVQFEITHRLFPLLDRALVEETTVDLQDVLERFAFDNICKVAFGVDPASLHGEHEGSGETPPEFMKAFDDAEKCLNDRFYDALAVTWRIKKLLNIGSERRLRESTKIVNDFAIKIIRSRKASPPTERDDLLSRFASSGEFTEEFLRDVVVNFMLAGRETTSSSLTWFFWLLFSRPEVRKRIFNEIKSIRAARERPPVSEGSYSCFSFDELREMHYLHAAITESMRLYPPVAVDSVSCKEEDVLPDGTFVGKEWFVTYSAYSMGRMERIWGKDCCEYRPERWLVEGVFQPESPFRFPAFHAGPRMCLGKEMAYIQMKSIAASVVESFDVEAVERVECPGYVLSLTLRMKGGLPVRVKGNRG